MPAPLAVPLPAPDFAVSVRTLCAFGAKTGDLDFRFVPAPTAQEGIAGHALVQSRRGPGFEAEVSLASRCLGLQVRGRADGYDAGRQRVEEIKTFRGRLDAMRANHRALHWAQARTYGWMLCERHALPAITVALVYLDLASGEETVLEAECTRDALQQAFEKLCATFVHWAAQESRHRSALHGELGVLGFPHASFRAGQRELASGVYRAAVAQRCLVAQAPTGIGKTIATTYPLLRAWPGQGTDKIFFLTAKTSGRAVALEAFERIGRGCASLRVLELSAREKVCEYPGRACNGEACPLARGFFDRLPAARSEAVALQRLDRSALRRVALAHAVCPYYLAQEMVRWSDVVVADFNHYFDSAAMLFALTRQEEWKVAVLVDEAHNLPDRARSMYTATLDPAALARVLAGAPRAVRPALVAVRREWQAVQDRQATRHAAADAVPDRLYRALQGAVTAIADHFGAAPDDAHGPLQQLFFDLLFFVRLCDAFGDHSVFESVVDGAGLPGPLTLRNLVPAPFLQGRFAASATTVCFSGTIAPFAFYRDVLGLPDDTLALDVPSPFESHQLRVRVVTDVSTRYADRARSLPRLVEVIAAQFAARPGNYLAFFSSFEYLDRAHALFARLHPGVPVWTQRPAMPEADREAFVARFAPGGTGVGFAVLGGAFGEGIDLPGDRLVGAFIATLGLPQHDAMNEVLRARMQALFGKGYEYACLYPALRKVVQAAGRVIRTEHDTGVLYLLDDRFTRSEVRCLLPPWWHVEHVRAAQPVPFAVA